MKINQVGIIYPVNDYFLEFEWSWSCKPKGISIKLNFNKYGIEIAKQKEKNGEIIWKSKKLNKNNK